MARNIHKYQVLDGPAEHFHELPTSMAHGYMFPNVSYENAQVIKAIMLGWRLMLTKPDDPIILQLLAEQIGFCIYKYNIMVDKYIMQSVLKGTTPDKCEIVARSQTITTNISTELNNLITAFFFIRNPPIVSLKDMAKNFIRVTKHA